MEYPLIVLISDSHFSLSFPPLCKFFRVVTTFVSSQRKFPESKRLLSIFSHIKVFSEDPVCGCKKEILISARQFFIFGAH